MNKVTPRSICSNCGQEVYQRALHIENFQHYDTTSKQSFISSLSKLEGVTQDVAKSWAEHGLFEKCETAIRHCPKCGNQLKTWMAKQCLKCGANFEPWKKVEQNT